MSKSKIYGDGDGDYDQNDGGGCNDDDDHGNDGDDNVDDKAAEANLCGGGQIIIRRGPLLFQLLYVSDDDDVGDGNDGGDGDDVTLS